MLMQQEFFAAIIFFYSKAFDVRHELVGETDKTRT
jgi:hypothetical protein